jgi:hypothetical protein
MKEGVRGMVGYNNPFGEGKRSGVLIFSSRRFMPYAGYEIAAPSASPIQPLVEWLAMTVHPYTLLPAPYALICYNPW